jgi:hypothetical protein
MTAELYEFYCRASTVGMLTLLAVRQPSCLEPPMRYAGWTAASLPTITPDFPFHRQTVTGRANVGMLWAPFDHVARCGPVERLDDGNKVETFWDHEKNRVMQVPEDVGATRRNRTGDLLITIPVLKKRLVKAKKQHEVAHASLTGRYIAVLKHPRNSPLNPA